MTEAHYKSLKPLIIPKNVSVAKKWRERLSSDCPLTLEIGVGNGEFLVRSALASPQTHFLGIEFRWEYAAKTLRRIAQANVENATVFWGDARFVLDWLIAPRSLERIIALFPCPWPKARHAHHRLFGTDFLRILNNRLRDQGRFVCVTDSQDFHDWIRDQNKETGFVIEHNSITPSFNTKYERKWSRLGQEKFYEINFIKDKHVDVVPKEEADLKTYRLESFHPERFTMADSTEEIVVGFKEFIYDSAQKKGLVRLAVAEGTLVQNIWVKIAGTATGWHIGADTSTSVAPTRGVQKAVDLVYAAASQTNKTA